MRCLVNNTLVTRYIDTTPLTPVTTQCGLVSGSWAAAVPAADDFYAEKAVDTGSAEYAKTAAGYTHLAFNDDFTDATTIDYANTGAAGYNWYLDRPWGASTLAASEVTVANSVMTLTQADSLYNWGISTYHYGTQHGRGFMHGYYEARMRFDPSYATAITHDIQWPAFWSESINTCINNPPTFAELDFFEAYHPPLDRHTTANLPAQCMIGRVLLQIILTAARTVTILHQRPMELTLPNGTTTAACGSPAKSVGILTVSLCSHRHTALRHHHILTRKTTLPARTLL